MSWGWPLKGCFPSVPVPPAPGSFGVRRKLDTHTGVDLYAPIGTEVVAVEDGTVVAVLPFTGARAGSGWWRETDAVLVEGASGVVLYGEISPSLSPGQALSAGSLIGSVKRVLMGEARPEIPGHLPSMLHLELYRKGVREPVWWKTEERPPDLLDPTPFLRRIQ